MSLVLFVGLKFRPSCLATPPPRTYPRAHESMVVVGSWRCGGLRDVWWRCCCSGTIQLRGLIMPGDSVEMKDEMRVAAAVCGSGSGSVGSSEGFVMAPTTKERTD